jgi:hypothetical protein
MSVHAPDPIGVTVNVACGPAALVVVTVSTLVHGAEDELLIVKLPL